MRPRLCDPEQRKEMLAGRVDTAVAHRSDQMDGRAIALCLVEGTIENAVLEKLHPERIAFLIFATSVCVTRPVPDAEMADLCVSGPVRVLANARARCRERGHRILAARSSS